jgi:hypothetical protein
MRIIVKVNTIQKSNIVMSVVKRIIEVGNRKI